MSWKDSQYPVGRQRHAAPPDLTLVAKDRTVAEQMAEQGLFAQPKQNPLAARRHTTFVVIKSGQMQTPPPQNG